jgi:hypothetical protein
MSHSRTIGSLLACVALLILPSAAHAEFGLVPGSASATARNQDGTIDVEASSHPYSYEASFALKTGAEGRTEGGEARDVIVDLPPGFVGNPQAVPSCSRKDYEGLNPNCPASTQVGVLRASTALGFVVAPLFNLTPPPGSAARLGGGALNFNALQDVFVRSEHGYGLRVGAFNLPVEVRAATETVWGIPADESHDAERTAESLDGGPPTPSDAPPLPFLTLPAQCDSPPQITVSADSKLAPGAFAEETAPSRDAGGNPALLTGCDAVPFSPTFSSQPTTKLGENPSGLDFELKLPNQGLLGPGAIAETEPRKTVITLPEGVTVNPSLAEGIGVCSEPQYRAESVSNEPNAGCPESSKLGSVEVHSPLIKEPVEGAVYLATPYENPFGTFSALYLIARAPERGILVKQAGKVEFDSQTGQITTTFESLPPLPFSDFKLHFREGARAPLVTPRACGGYVTVAKLTPFSSTDAIERKAFFQVERGADGGACPSGGLSPFRPDLNAGALNNAAGAFSPFYIRLSRTDAEQEITHFSIKLPPGVVAKLAGVSFCPDADIAAAKAREGTHRGGQEEIEAPSCPASSEIGHSLVGTGVGQVLAYVPGKVYLAGPYHGSQLSIVAITAAKVGPFDLGTVVVREALRINPETGEVFVDATGSDPLPHIVSGVPTNLRDIRVYVDRPQFALNPTGCEPTSTASTVLGSGLDFVSEADDNPVTITSRFQAADCASLGFKPRLSLKLQGPSGRGGNPALRVVLRPRQGDANARRISVALPHSEFLDQGHIKTICTRVQFAAGVGNGAECPAGSVYGHARAWTPLFSEPLEGPIFLRANGGERDLPDLVLALHGLVNIDSVGYVDSVKGGIRNTFAFVPDAPISKVVVQFGSGKKSLLENSTNICVGTHRATVQMTGHNGRLHNFRPRLQPDCGKKKGKKRKSRGKKG